MTKQYTNKQEQFLLDCARDSMSSMLINDYSINYTHCVDVAKSMLKAAQEAGLLLDEMTDFNKL